MRHSLPPPYNPYLPMGRLCNHPPSMMYSLILSQDGQHCYGVCGYPLPLDEGRCQVRRQISVARWHALQQRAKEDAAYDAALALMQKETP